LATATSDTELVTDSVVILIATEIDEKIFELITAHGSSWLNKINLDTTDDKQKKEEEKDAEKKGENEEEIREENQEVNIKEEQDEDDNIPSPLKNKSSELQERVKKLEAQVGRYFSKMQDEEEQNVEQGGEDQFEEERSEDDRLAVLTRENSEFKKNMNTLSNTVVRMEMEIKILKLAK